MTEGVVAEVQAALIRVEPGGLEFEAQVGETIMAAAQRNGLRWPTVCGGVGECLVCRVVVADGTHHLSPAEPLEASRLSFLNAARPENARYRMACQAHVFGNVVVHKRGVR